MAGKNMYTDTAKWEDRWFMSLSPEHKLAWLYICDRCDQCGVIEINEPLADFQIGMHIDWERFIAECRDRLFPLPKSGRYLIVKYVEFQQKGKVLSRGNNAHVGAYRNFFKYGLTPEEFGYSLAGEPRGKKAQDSPKKTKKSAKSCSENLDPNKTLARATGKGKGKGKGNSSSDRVTTLEDPARDDRDLNREPDRPATSPPRDEPGVLYWELGPGKPRQKAILRPEHDTPEVRAAVLNWIEFCRIQSETGRLNPITVDAHLQNMARQCPDAESALAALDRSVRAPKNRGSIYTTEWPERAPGAKFGAQDRSEQDNRPNVRELIAKGVI